MGLLGHMVVLFLAFFLFFLLRNLHTVFHSGCYQFTFPPTVQEGSFFSHPLQDLLFVDFFDDGHSDWYEVISHCNFYLHFSNDEQC